MDKGAVVNLFSTGAWAESERLEWKLSTRGGKEIVQTAVAFANTAGGVILCGVRDDGEVVGQDISDATVREMT